ncbi:MAG: FAD-binding protein [Rhodobacteraceae bacterium]|nr:FAD-binding protein [Paracoccaceae bacterium]
MLNPQTEAELAAAVAGANGPLWVSGGGTRIWDSAARPEALPSLDTSGLSGISLYEPEALTMVVQAGTPLAEVQDRLRTQHQHLAFEPPDYRHLLGSVGTPTVGGAVATNASGPRRVAAGACRDFCLGVRFVDGRGRVLKNGGRVMKNVTGYDLVKVMAGSYGTLGVVTEVSLKVLPMPATTATLRVHNVAGWQGLQVMVAAMQSPFEVSAAAHRAGDVWLRLEGFEDSVAYRVQALTALLAPHGDITAQHDQAENARLWDGIRDIAPLAPCAYVWRVSMKPSAVYRGLLGKAVAQVDLDAFTDWAGALCWLGLTQEQAADLASAAVQADRDQAETPADAGARALHRRLQAAVVDPTLNEGGGGHATLIKAPQTMLAQVRRFQPQPAPIARLSQNLRAQFDPRGILNPELMA